VIGRDTQEGMHKRTLRHLLAVDGVVVVVAAYKHLETLEKTTTIIWIGYSN